MSRPKRGATVEFSEFDLRIEVWAAEHGIHLTFEDET